MEALYFDDYADGFTFETQHRTITDFDISTFVGLNNFYGPMFMDLEYVGKSEYYSGRLVPGLLTLSMAEGLVIQSGVLHDRGLAFMDMTSNFEKPVLSGDTIYCTVNFKSKRLTSKADRGVVVTDHVVSTTRGVVTIRYTTTRMVKTRKWGQKADA